MVNVSSIGLPSEEVPPQAQWLAHCQPQCSKANRKRAANTAYPRSTCLPGSCLLKCIQAYRDITVVRTIMHPAWIEFSTVSATETRASLVLFCSVRVGTRLSAICHHAFRPLLSTCIGFVCCLCRVAHKHAAAPLRPFLLLGSVL